KLSALGQMAAGIAHEINNPLSIIAGYSEDLRVCCEQGNLSVDKMREITSKIELTVARITKIIKSMRTLTRESAQDPPTEVAAQTIVADTIELCQNRFRGQGVHLRVSELPSVSLSCRSGQIVQVLINLLNNAFDAATLGPEKWVAIDLIDEGNFVCFAVTD